MRVALATDFYYPWVGGPARVVHTLAHGLAGAGHQVSLLAPSPDGPPSLETDGLVEIRRVRTLRVPFGYGVRASAFPLRAALDWLDAFQPDVVHVHHPFPLSVAVVVAARHRHIPVVATNHTIPECSLWGIRDWGPVYSVADGAFGAWIRLVLSSCRAVVTPTWSAADALRRLGYTHSVQAISNGVDTARFRPGPPNIDLRAKLGLSDQPVVLYTGRLDAEKDMEVWIRAAARAAALTNAQFVVGGEGTDREMLESLTAQLGMRNRISFIGYLSEEEYADLYRLAAVYFITSPVELQSIGTLEAVSSGLPVVAVDAGALPELVHPHQNGYLVPIGDWDAAAHALASILHNDQRREQMGRRGREIGLTHDVQATVRAYEVFLMGATGLEGEQQVEPAFVGEC